MAPKAKQMAQMPKRRRGMKEFAITQDLKDIFDKLDQKFKAFDSERHKTPNRCSEIVKEAEELVEMFWELHTKTVEEKTAEAVQMTGDLQEAVSDFSDFQGIFRLSTLELSRNSDFSDLQSIFRLSTPELSRPAQPSPAQLSPAQLSQAHPAQFSPAQPSSGHQPGSAQHSSAQRLTKRWLFLVRPFRNLHRLAQLSPAERLTQGRLFLVRPFRNLDRPAQPSPAQLAQLSSAQPSISLNAGYF